MNKKLFMGGCGLAAVAGSVFAAEEGDYSYFNPYAALKGGYAYLGKRNDIKYKGGFAGAVELGVSYDAWRLGLELGYKSNKIKELHGSKYMHVPNGKNKTDATATTQAHFTDNSVFKANANDVPFTGALLNHWYVHNITRLELTKLTALTGMVNICYDYAMTEAWSVYAGIGFGVARVTIPTRTRIFNGIHDLNCAAAAVPGNNTGKLPDAVQTAYNTALGTIFENVQETKTELSKTVFAWQLMAGVGYEFNENWKLTLGYKLFNTAKVDVLGGNKLKMPFNHTAEVGLVYTF